MAIKPLSLKQWIDQVGAIALAKKLGVAESAVRQWRRGHCLPRTEQMARIKTLSRGAVTYDEMIDTHVQQKAAK